MSEILERLQRLEQRSDALAAQNRRLRGVLFIVLAIGGVATYLMGSPATAQDKDKPTTIKAKSFVVVDERGNKRAALGMAPSGVGLVFYDAKENAEVVLGNTEDGANLTFFEGGVRRVQMQLKKGTPLLRLFDSKGKNGAAVQVSKDRPAVVLLADNEESQATMALFESGPRLQFKYLKQGTFVVATTKASTRLELIHDTGKPALQLMATGKAAGLSWVQRKDSRGSLLLDDRDYVPSFVDGDGRPLLPRLLKK